jgi:hypothetical protein
MGMFDSVYLRCPRCGSTKNELQTKVGECLMREFTVYTAPPKVLAALDGESVICECGETLTLRFNPPAVIEIGDKPYPTRFDMEGE